MTEINEEIFKEIPNFDDYLISNFGRVKSFKQNEARIKKNQNNNCGYYFVRLINNNGRTQTKYIHRLLAELFIPNTDNLLYVDHIDTHTLNNDLSNLRWVSLSQNQFNRNKQKQKSSSKYKGVTYVKKTNKWQARIRFEGKQYHLGCYASEIEAALAYNQTARKFFKQFAKLNEIDES